ncbi:hypothetical protein RKE38_10730 [Phycicoccus sp. M110.8]|uniref:hypothetical protein n=1 Tax=Phycicoccus sp. M110.8 TaxID=3075433 RepID=UPI0028FDA02C|nr:hypothetical protein [Phycicoccus sp. M110.8]MDU0314160.1 hypothetical protein [Phycicoccus sp. M110.8]
MTNSMVLLDVGLGATGRAIALVRLGARGVQEAGRRTRPLVDPLTRLSRLAPVPSGLRPAHWLGVLGHEGSSRRRRLRQELVALVDVLVPRVAAEVLGRVDVTGLVTEYVDLDEVVAGVDLDRAVRRVDIEAVVRGVDVDAVVARADLDAVLERVDVDAVVARADLDRVIERVDVDAVVARADLDRVIERIDVDAVVARADLDRVIERIDMDAVLDRLDLTSVVLQRVDLDAVVQAVLARLDLIGLADQVIDGVNLAEIIRESTGSMASDTVQEARMQGITADEAVSHVVDRFLLRHGRRSTGVPAGKQPSEVPPPELQLPGDQWPGRQVADENPSPDGHPAPTRDRVP